MGNLGGVFSQENTPEGHTNVHFFPHKEVSSENGDHQWLRTTNAFILCDLLWKIQKDHAVNREGSFKMNMQLTRYSLYMVANGFWGFFLAKS